MHSLILFLLAALSIAAPAPSPVATRSTSCMCAADAEKVAQNFADLINKPFSTPLARASMLGSFVDYSDSVSELINSGCNTGPKTLGQATFVSREDFITSQSGQPPISFEILQIWPSCESLTMRWRSSQPGTVQPEQIVTGIVVIETEANPDAGAEQPFLMKTVFSEFNSGAWLYDIVSTLDRFSPG